MSSSQLEEQLPAGSLEPRPDYVFHLRYGAEQEARFQQLATPHGTFLAFHGSAVECFHSIVHNGLLNMFNKVSETRRLPRLYGFTRPTSVSRLRRSVKALISPPIWG